MDAFFSLSSGAKFNKKKFSKDVELFQSKKVINVKRGETILDKKTLPAELDFFNSNPVNVNNVKASIKEKDNASESDEDVLEPINTKAEAEAFRSSYKIKVYGSDVPHPLKDFTQLINRTDISKLQKNLKELPYSELTPIQMQAIPIILENRDILACAPTGTGKTMAFAIPTLMNLKVPSKEGYRALVVSPTRELALQIHNQFQRLATGTNFRIQHLTKATAAALNQPAEYRPKFDVLITTPLRLVHAIKEKKIDLTKVTQLVLDEADKLFEMGFIEQVDDIIAACTSSSLRKALFSATIPSGVETLASSIMNDVIRVIHGTKDGATELIQQELLYAGQESGKVIALRNIIRKGLLPPAIIFVQSVERAQQLYKELVYDNLHVDVIHSDRPQSHRDSVLARFRQGDVWILIATDILARGLDFRGVNLVINYDFPQTIQSYVHRIGRTGRAGRPGRAVTFFTDVDAEYLRSQDAKKKLKRKPTERDDIIAQPKSVLRDQKKKKEMIAASKRRHSSKDLSSKDLKSNDS
ncbi:RNA-dependent ATPase rok1 [Entomophthora muscae]|uniref:RNA-dependent ATPase rok1 n=1 Tax=Entomophthora muscae TaxID=34485 RepID=A0ACC2SD45_9FUNG|nr:RNA-dependent ATPase rok1 [Entomophthora muscae]